MRKAKTLNLVSVIIFSLCSTNALPQKPHTIPELTVRTNIKPANENDITGALKTTDLNVQHLVKTEKAAKEELTEIAAL